MRNRILSVLFTAIFALWVGTAHATAWTNGAMPPVGGTNRVAYSQGLISSGGGTTTGSIVVNAIGVPTAPTVTTNGTVGATSLIYACTALDVNNNATLPSSTTTITTANATLSATNSVNVFCPGKTGALSFLIHKADTAHVIGQCYTTSGVGCTFVDQNTTGTVGSGGATSYTYTAPAVDQTGGISQVTGANGKTVTVRAAATNVASPITMCTTSGLNGACTEPTIVFVPGFADTAYTVTCSCTGSNTAVPELVSIVKASNSLVVGIVSAGATPSASCAEIDCTAIHD